MGVVNYMTFGSFTEFGYGFFASLATHDGWKGLIGLLISPGAGLLFYFPIAILRPLGAWYMYKEHKALFPLSAYIIILNCLEWSNSLGTQISDTGSAFYDNRNREHIHAFEEKIVFQNIDCGVVCSRFRY
jgi:hypothetical protein